jgi:hypothetical protein
LYNYAIRRGWGRRYYLLDFAGGLQQIVAGQLIIIAGVADRVVDIEARAVPGIVRGHLAAIIVVVVCGDERGLYRREVPGAQ